MVFIAVAGRGAVYVEEAHLLGLLIGDGGALGERIEIEVAELLAVAALRPGLNNRPARGRTPADGCAPDLPARELRRAGDEQRLRILVGSPGGIRQGHPTLHVDLAVALVIERDVVGAPAETRS